MKKTINLNTYLGKYKKDKLKNSWEEQDEKENFGTLKTSYSMGNRDFAKQLDQSFKGSYPSKQSREDNQQTYQPY